MGHEAVEVGFEHSLRLNPRQPGVWCALGEARLRANKLVEARAAFGNALELDQGMAAAHFGLAMICKQQTQAEAAIAHYRAGLAYAPHHAQALLDLGVLCAENNRTEQAVECWHTILEREPEHAQAHHNVGVAMAQLGKPEEAIRFLSRAIELRPNYAEAFFNLANVLCNQKGRDNDRRAEGVERYREAIRLRPNYIEVIYNLGAVLTDVNRPVEAVIWLRQAARLGEVVDRGVVNGESWSVEREKPKEERGGPTANHGIHPLTASAYNQLGIALCA